MVNCDDSNISQSILFVKVIIFVGSGGDQGDTGNNLGSMHLTRYSGEWLWTWDD